MNLADAVKSGFSNYARFSGRARRSEFWFWTLFAFLVSVVASILDRVLGTGYSTAYGDSGGVVQTITGLALLLPGLAVSWRRLHDTGRSGLWLLTVLIPLAGIVFAVILIVWACQDSQPGPNQHGPNPKGIGGGHDSFPGQPNQFGGQYGQPGQPGQYGQPGPF